MQKLTIIGNVGSDAVIRAAKAGGKEFVSFNVACNETYKNADGTKVEKTTWYDCIYRRTEVAPFIKKGDQIHVEGTPTYTIFQNRAGHNEISVSLSASDLVLLNNPRKDQ